MKKILFTGFVTLLPLALTIMIVAWLFNFFTTPFVGIIESFVLSFEQSRGMTPERHDLMVLFISRLISFVFLLFLCFVLGFFARKFFFDVLMGYTNKILSRIPIVKTIYSLSREVTKAVFSGKEKAFKKTVLVPFPSRDTHTLAFVTGEIPEGLKKIISEEHLSVFVPTSPHPMSGYMVMTPKNQIIDVDVTTEEAFKFLLSCGASVPMETPQPPPPHA